jgi:hypothetical protein
MPFTCMVPLAVGRTCMHEEIAATVWYHNATSVARFDRLWRYHFIRLSAALVWHYYECTQRRSFYYACPTHLLPT